jgi:Type ISP C-terminal specificity domain/N-6 DNA Methylase
MDALASYLGDLYEIRSSGGAVKETSGYPALSQLLNETGKTLKPKVRCVINLQNQGAGLPDGGLYSAEQYQKRGKSEPLEGQLPARGCIEVKSPGEDALNVAKGEQVRRYLNRYRQVLVTNYRDFVLVALDRDQNLQIRERFTLAENETDFWRIAAHPQAAQNELGERFVEYLKRVMLHAAPLALPKDVAWFLASYARDAKARIESKCDLPALMTVRSALEEALGLKFEGDKGDHFFRSTLVQTLFYGVFSSWVLWSKSHPPANREARFNWHEAAWSLHVPMIKALFDQIATPTQLRELNIVGVLDWTTDVLNRVDRKAFFENFEEGHAVQYFYEPFLQAFDPELRKELGVWYTPSEIVKYMVARVDTVLREELKIPDGLADPRVYVLDPSCGTGAYLVEVLRRIHETLKAKGEDALAANDLKRAAIDRVFGFEILPAPFVVSHLQLGLLLQNLGAPLIESTNERVGVYLTNALTGWEPPSEEVKARLQQLAFSFAELRAEYDAAERVKQEVPILVILGNPPYNAFAGTSPEEEQGLVEPYKEGLIREWGIKKFNLDDLYVRFFRLAERRVAQSEGVICYISNYSYLSDASFVVARQRFLAEFDKLWFDSMNGDSRETGKLTPEGKPDPSVFSTEYNREGIRLGTAIGLLVRKAQRDDQPTVRFRQFWGAGKRGDLVASLHSTNLDADYQTVVPDKANRFSFRTSDATAQYMAWPKLVELCSDDPISGLQEMRKGTLMSMDRLSLEQRMREYLDPDIDWATLKALKAGPTVDGGRFDAAATREKLQTQEPFKVENIRRYALYPFDVRWCYHSNVRPLWNEPRPALSTQSWQGNSFIITRMLAERPNEQIVITTTSALPDYHLLRPNAVAIPIRIRPIDTKKEPDMQNHFFEETEASEAATNANLSAKARDYLDSLGIHDPDASEVMAELVWMHSLTIGHAPAYLSENADGIRQDWPRIPLPSKKESLLHSADLGRRIAALLDTEQGVAGVTSGTITDPFKNIGTITHVTRKSLDPVEDLKVTAGWGHAGKGGVTMPGKGKLIERDCTPDERKAIDRGAQLLGLTKEEAVSHLGERTCDVYLNDNSYWRNIPTRVWEYTIGGYQVIKKWLSYRELELLGRPLSPDEAREVMNMARRIAAIVLLEPALDANYATVKASTYEWTQ